MDIILNYPVWKVGYLDLDDYPKKKRYRSFLIEQYK
ncbi:MAG: hypothetical protein RL440_733 [Bacteroidota bacterium]